MARHVSWVMVRCGSSTVSNDDNPELSHITTVAEASAMAAALLEICRQATEQIQIVVRDGQ